MATNMRDPRNFVQETGNGVRGVDREIFTDAELFELEIKYIWEKLWNYLAHESEIPEPKCFVTRWIGRIPVIVYRDREGELRGFVNVCMHRGATLCRTSRGKTKNFVCPFHGWAYNDKGDLIAPMHEESGAYPVGFNKEQLGLREVHLESYRGFVFGTVNPQIGNLQDYLAETKPFIDIIVDQSPQGIEVLKGESTYTFRGNWKLQVENGVDGYHVDAVHANYLQTVMRRHQWEGSVGDGGKGAEKTKAMDPQGLSREASGYYALGNGHTLLWADWPNPEDRPIFERFGELKEFMGKVKAQWAVGRLRNLLIYPNVFFMDQMSTQIRMFRPIDVDLTEVTTYCFAPIGESRVSRYRRLRQYEDFFNASGMATPDDLAQFDESQKGFQARDVHPWNEMSRGAEHEVKGANELAKELGIRPISSGSHGTDEGIYMAQHARWAELLEEAFK